MLLLTGATGLVGSTLLARLLADGTPVRCLVRDPRRLGADRVRVQIALGDLADPPSFRNALRGVTTVVHLAAAIRDQPRGSIEELNGIATWRLVQAAERAGVQRFIHFSALSASAHDRTRFLRAKALAEQAVLASDLQRLVLAPSLVYAPGDVFMTLLGHMALAPVVPVSGRGRARFEPIWAADVAACVTALIAGGGDGRERYELAGPEVVTHTELVRRLLQAAGRPRPLVHVPTAVVSRVLRATEAILGSRAPATWDQAELMEVSMISACGVADARALGVDPRPMTAVLGDSCYS
ncbi:NAD-dependent epimerase/dehydratase family protein [Baekduia soli]|uniref:NAD-dependent epimerase/dehydratase family protein n=1 Tax=Baekduia soli TaxID=496014 RepID=A0A5B8U101_9ACTN|nr:NAD(P)H-binding protein [Baekduia soli]QEC46602.1 NAD-dependent epimerase/dehydratase family protein [Baekduia soli]